MTQNQIAYQQNKIREMELAETKRANLIKESLSEKEIEAKTKQLEAQMELQLEQAKKVGAEAIVSQIEAELTQLRNYGYTDQYYNVVQQVVEDWGRTLKYYSDMLPWKGLFK